MRKAIEDMWALLLVRYPGFGKESTKNQIVARMQLFERLLSDIPDEMLKAATMQHMATSNFFPQESEIRKIASELTEKNESSPEEAWGKLKLAIRRHGAYNEPRFRDGRMQRAVDVMGWRYLCLSDNEVADRAHFFRIYGAIQEREKFDGRLLPEVRDVVNRLIGSGDTQQIAVGENRGLRRVF